MSDLTRYVTAYALGSASFLSGYIAMYSVAIPGLKLAPSTLAAQQWHLLYERGRNSAPAIALTTCSAFSYLAYLAGDTNRGWALAGAGAATIAIAPFTLTVMIRTNNTLHDWAKRVAPRGEDKDAAVVREASWKKEVDDLLEYWQILNLARAVMPGVGALVGFWVVFGW